VIDAKSLGAASVIQRKERALRTVGATAPGLLSRGRVRFAREAFVHPPFPVAVPRHHERLSERSLIDRGRQRRTQLRKVRSGSAGIGRGETCKAERRGQWLSQRERCAGGAHALRLEERSGEQVGLAQLLDATSGNKSSPHFGQAQTRCGTGTHAGCSRSVRPWRYRHRGCAPRNARSCPISETTPIPALASPSIRSPTRAFELPWTRRSEHGRGCRPAWMPLSPTAPLARTARCGRVSWMSHAGRMPTSTATWLGCRRRLHTRQPQREPPGRATARPRSSTRCAARTRRRTSSRRSRPATSPRLGRILR
jgi:hypothetical protein